jgi:two-component system, OmpR family, response regulator AdeR
MTPLVLIAESDAETADGLDASLRREGFRTALASDGQAVLDLQDSLKPDLIFLGADLPVRDGWDVLGEVRRRGETPVIMLATQGREAGRLQALRIGADDYLIQPLTPVEAAARARAILRRTLGAQKAKVLRVGPLEVQLENYLAAVILHEGRRRLDLTLTEFRILAHMARTPLRVFSRADIMQACFPNQDVLERTIDSHVSHLRRKLETSGAAGLLRNVRGVGYRLEPET